MHWSVLNELGLDYAPPLPERSQERLHFPVLVERGPDGATLIVDELGKEKGDRKGEGPTRSRYPKEHGKRRCRGRARAASLRHRDREGPG